MKYTVNVLFMNYSCVICVNPSERNKQLPSCHWVRDCNTLLLCRVPRVHPCCRMSWTHLLQSSWSYHHHMYWAQTMNWKIKTKKAVVRVMVWRGYTTLGYIPYKSNHLLRMVRESKSCAFGDWTSQSLSENVTKNAHREWWVKTHPGQGFHPWNLRQYLGSIWRNVWFVWPTAPIWRTLGAIEVMAADCQFCTFQRIHFGDFFVYLRVKGVI